MSANQVELFVMALIEAHRAGNGPSEGLILRHLLNAKVSVRYTPHGVEWSI